MNIGTEKGGKLTVRVESWGSIAAVFAFDFRLALTSNPCSQIS